MVPAVLRPGSNFLCAQIFEVVNDGAMKRTMGRPLPAGRMSGAHALAWAVGTGVSGIALLATQVTPRILGKEKSTIPMQTPKPYP